MGTILSTPLEDLTGSTGKSFILQQVSQLSPRKIRLANGRLALVWLQLMAGGPAFLRPEEELTTRLCFVCFDGTDGLQESRRLGLDHDLPEDFVRNYAANVFNGIRVSELWRATKANVFTRVGPSPKQNIRPRCFGRNVQGSLWATILCRSHAVSVASTIR